MRHIPILTALSLALAANVALGASAGQAAPEFVVNDSAGKAVRLSDYHGKFVVLEWTNPECPFVQKHYNSANMPALQKEWGAKDVVWLTINSTNSRHGEYKSPSEMASWMRAQ